MRRWLPLLALPLLASLPAPAAAQTTRDSVVCTQCVPVVTPVPDSAIARVDTTWRHFTRDSVTYRDSVVTVPVVTPPDTTPAPPPPLPGTNEPPGLRTIILLDFAALKLPASFVSGPNLNYGITLGKVQVPHQSNRSVPSPLGYAHRCSFGPALIPGRGPGCYFEAKEDLAGNTSGTSITSYRLWYETGLFRFGQPDSTSAALGPTFENVGSDGFKLFGYWGGMCPGNITSTALILWGAPAENRKDGFVTPVGKWRAQVRWNNACGPNNTNVQPWKTQNYGNAPTFTAGAWHTYEVLLDAGDVGQANGSVTLWIDGVRMIRYTGVLRTASAPRGWYGRHWNPVMNGKVTLRKTRQDVLDIDRVRVAVGQPVD